MLPFRGAIGYGDLIVDSDDGIFVGEAIEDAYRAEQSQAWLGCILTQECAQFAESKKYISSIVDNVLGPREVDPTTETGKFMKFPVQYRVPLVKHGTCLRYYKEK